MYFWFSGRSRALCSPCESSGISAAPLLSRQNVVCGCALLAGAAAPGHRAARRVDGEGRSDAGQWAGAWQRRAGWAHSRDRDAVGTDQSAGGPDRRRAEGVAVPLIARFPGLWEAGSWPSLRTGASMSGDDHGAGGAGPFQHAVSAGRDGDIAVRGNAVTWKAAVPDTFEPSSTAPWATC